MDEQARSNWWHTQPNGKRCRDYAYSDLAIQTFLMLQAIFGLSLRQTEGFLDSLFVLMGVELKSPDYSSVSKRARQVGIKLTKPNGAAAHLVLDATGLKVFGEGEWKVRKHGKEKRRTWRKLHLRNYNAQVSEAMARVAVLNKMTGLGMPMSEMIR